VYLLPFLISALHGGGLLISRHGPLEPRRKGLRHSLEMGLGGPRTCLDSFNKKKIFVPRLEYKDDLLLIRSVS